MQKRKNLPVDGGCGWWCIRKTIRMGGERNAEPLLLMCLVFAAYGYVPTDAASITAAAAAATAAATAAAAAGHGALELVRESERRRERDFQRGADVPADLKMLYRRGTPSAEDPWREVEDMVVVVPSMIVGHYECMPS